MITQLYHFCKCGHYHFEKKCGCGCINYEFLCEITPNDLCENCNYNFGVCHISGQYKNGNIHACIMINHINVFKHKKLYECLTLEIEQLGFGIMSNVKIKQIKYCKRKYCGHEINENSLIGSFHDTKSGVCQIDDCACLEAINE